VTSGGQTTFVLGNGNFPQALTVGDFNGDGLLDLAATDIAATVNVGNVTILLGTGGGSFGAPTTFAVEVTPLSLAVADFNGDGHLDLAVVNRDGPGPGVDPGTVSILLGIGDGSFLPQTVFTVGSEPQSVAVADFNGDGHPDLAVSNSDDRTVSVLLGTGTGSFGPQSTLAAGPGFDVVEGGTEAVAVGDFNGDGRPDLAVTDDDLSVSILLNVCN
jgi:hypothetical protein